MDYALNKIGAVPSYIYPNITKEEIQYFINEVEAKYIFTIDEQNILKNVLAATENIKIEKIIVSPVLQSFPKWFKLIAKLPRTFNNEKIIIMWDDLLKLNVKDIKENEYIVNDLCCLMHTSGTTSVSKAVMQSNENINATSKNYYKDGLIWEMEIYIYKYCHCLLLLEMQCFILCFRQMLM